MPQNIYHKARLSAENRCKIVMERTNGINELKQRKIKLLERQLFKLEGFPEGIYDRSELDEINRILEIESLKMQIQ